jgi:hypothetical protein
MFPSPTMSESDEQRISPAARARGETELQRVDRNLEELMGELRVALPGVQVLFAFLLILPFNARFAELSGYQEKIYFGTLICTALASALLIAPSMHHRLHFRAGRKEQVLRVAHRTTMVGLTLLAVAICGATALVGDFVFGGAVAGISTGFLVVAFIAIWYLLPQRS